MATFFTPGNDRVSVERSEAARGATSQPDLRSPHRVDSNAVRWVFALTVAFWLVAYAAGRALLF